MKGVGIHCFAGGFTMGMKQALPVVGQLEIHNFGRDTCEKHDTKFMNADKWEDWQDYKSTWESCSFCYGNPRCTAFSSYSAGCNSTVRGPKAKPVQDIWDLCRFSVQAGFELIAFESVQQCYTVGRQLLNMIIEELFEPNGYRVAHLFVNTAAEGNVQKRRRYFFVAYKKHKNFNIMLPQLPKYRTTIRDAIWEYKDLPTTECKLHSKCAKYTADTCWKMPDKEKVMIPHLLQGESYYDFAKLRPELLEQVSPEHYDKWMCRTSGIPFSLHAPVRLHWDKGSPTICSTSVSLIHPTNDRPLTVREIAALMGWPKGFIPAGTDPVGQIGKGVVPATGKWLGEQIKLYLEDFWGDEDFESKYDHRKNQFIGDTFTNTEGPLEKTFNITSYIPDFKETA